MSLAKKYSLKTQILNKNEEILSNKEIIIINYFGGLNNLYRHAKSVLIGKSISKEFKMMGVKAQLKQLNLIVKFIMDLMFIILKIYIKFLRKKISQKLYKIIRSLVKT